MDRLTRIASLATAALLALALSSCAPVRINSYLERGVDFQQYRTYAWGPADGLSTGDPRLDNNRFFSERVERAVNQQLASRGFEKRESGAADVLIHMHARIDQRIESRCHRSRVRALPRLGLPAVCLRRRHVAPRFHRHAYESTRLARLGRRQF